MFSEQQAFIVTFICPSSGWSPAPLMVYPKFFDWLLKNKHLTSTWYLFNLMWIFDSFSLPFFHTLPLSECLCNREHPESLSACIHLWIQYIWYTCHFTARATSEFFYCPNQCYKFLPTTKVLQSVSYFPLIETFYYCKYLPQFMLLAGGKDNSVWSLLPTFFIEWISQVSFI